MGHGSCCYHGNCTGKWRGNDSWTLHVFEHKNFKKINQLKTCEHGKMHV